MGCACLSPLKLAGLRTSPLDMRSDSTLPSNVHTAPNGLVEHQSKAGTTRYWSAEHLSRLCFHISFCFNQSVRRSTIDGGVFGSSSFLC